MELLELFKTQLQHCGDIGMLSISNLDTTFQLVVSTTQIQYFVVVVQQEAL